MYSFEEFRKLDSDTQFKYFMNNLATSNKNAEYFVNWAKVFNNVRELSISLNTVNYLLGKKNIKEEALHLFNRQPELLKVIPILIATRDTKVLSSSKLPEAEELRPLHNGLMKSWSLVMTIKIIRIQPNNIFSAYINLYEGNL